MKIQITHITRLLIALLMTSYGLYTMSGTNNADVFDPITQHIKTNWEKIYKSPATPYFETSEDFAHDIIKKIKSGAELYLEISNPEKKDAFFTKIKAKNKTKNDWKNFFADLLWFFYAYQNFFSVSPNGPERYSIVMPKINDRLGETLLNIFSYLSDNQLPGEKEPFAKRRNYEDVKKFSNEFLPQFDTQTLYTSSLFYPEQGYFDFLFGRKKSTEKPIILPNNDQSIVFKHASDKNDSDKKLFVMRPEQYGLSDPKNLFGKKAEINALLDAREITPKAFQKELTQYINDQETEEPLFKVYEKIEKQDDSGAQLIKNMILPNKPDNQIGCEISTKPGTKILKLFAQIISSIEDIDIKTFRNKILERKSNAFPKLIQELIEKNIPLYPFVEDIATWEIYEDPTTEQTEEDEKSDYDTDASLDQSIFKEILEKKEPPMTPINFKESLYEEEDYKKILKEQDPTNPILNPEPKKPGQSVFDKKEYLLSLDKIKSDPTKKAPEDSMPSIISRLLEKTDPQLDGQEVEESIDEDNEEAEGPIEEKDTNDSSFFDININ